MHKHTYTSSNMTTAFTHAARRTTHAAHSSLTHAARRKHVQTCIAILIQRNAQRVEAWSVPDARPGEASRFSSNMEAVVGGCMRSTRVKPEPEDKRRPHLIRFVQRPTHKKE